MIVLYSSAMLGRLQVHARRVGGEFYTADRGELQHVSAEVCPVTFIR